MIDMHPITSIARRLGGLVALFEPGTSFHAEVVRPVVSVVDRAETRDQLEQALDHLNAGLAPHLMDTSMQELAACMQELASLKTPWPVDAFKEGFLVGLGEQLPDDGHTAGRALDPHTTRK